MARPTARTSATTLLLVSTLLMGSPAWTTGGSSLRSDQDNKLYVTERSGSVSVTMAGTERAVAVDSAVELPARIVTGADGSLGLRQSRTTLSVAAGSDIEIPEAARDGQLIARLVQHRGNVFYDVESRPVEKFHVDTPYLVAVVKGTQFNVSVDDDRTMISLFEGQLELQMPDGSGAIDLDAGEIAIRSRADAAIRVLSMDAAGPVNQADAGRGDLRLPASADGSRGDTLLSFAGWDGAAVVSGLSAELQSLDVVGGDAGVDTNVSAGVSLGKSPEATLGLDTSVDLGAGNADLGLDTTVDLGAGSADLGLDTTVDLGGGTGVDASIDLGGVTDTLGLDTTIDLGVDLTTDPVDDPGTGGLLDLTPTTEEPGGGLLGASLL